MPRFQAQLIPAMVTPFRRDGSVEHERLEQLALHLIDHGCDGLLVNGTTGESPTLTEEERLENIRVVRAAVRHRNIPLMAGVGSNCTHKTVEEAKAAALLGVDALLVVVPYYNRPTQEGLFEHFRQVAQAVPDTEIVIYNIPSRSVVRMAETTMARLHEQHPNVVGVKQSYPDMEAVSAISALLPPETWLTWCGDDALTLPMMACGAHGTVSVLAHLAGDAMQAMIRHVKANQLAEAQALHYRLLPLAQGLFTLPNPTVVKACLARLGFMELAYRSPMMPPSEEEFALVERVLSELQALPVVTVAG